MKQLRWFVALSAVLACAVAYAGSMSDVVPVGGGKFMLTGRNATVFGSSDGIAAKLITKAHQYCEGNGGGEAVLLDKDGESAAVGVRTASSTIYFRCDAKTPAPATSSARRYYVALEDGSVSFQLTLPTGADCEEMIASVAEEHRGYGQCVARSQAPALPFISVLSDGDDDVMLLRARTLDDCTRLTQQIAQRESDRLATCVERK